LGLHHDEKDFLWAEKTANEKANYLVASMALQLAERTDDLSEFQKEKQLVAWLELRLIDKKDSLLGEKTVDATIWWVATTESKSAEKQDNPSGI
jgi:hypothetical protein